MVVTGLALLLLLLASVVLDTAGASAVADALDYAAVAAFAILPYAFLAGLVRSRYSRAGAVGELIEALNDPDRRVELRDALADALGDPTLGLLFWRESAGQYVTADGRPVELPGPGSGRAVTEVRARRGAGRATARSSAPSSTRRRWSRSPSSSAWSPGPAGLALDNERLEAELRARVEELQRSRARLLDISTFERRRLERDLHDGAQQRLVALSLQLSLAERKLESDPDVAAPPARPPRARSCRPRWTSCASSRAGIHPAILTDRGLGPALAGTRRARAASGRPLRHAAGAPAAVRRGGRLLRRGRVADERRQVRPRPARRRLDRPGRRLRRRGGPRRRRRRAPTPGDGTGLRGLADRLAALDGRLEVHSPPGRGTLVRAKIPCASS